MDRRHRRRGITLLEILVVVGIIAIIAAILLPVLGKARAASQKIACLSNLRSIGMAFHLYAEHNVGRLPDPNTTRISWEASLLPYTNGGAFRCPSDSEVYPVLGSSYDWRDTPDPNTSLAGQNILLPQRSSLVLAFESLPGWHGKKRMNVCFLGDGSAHEMDYEAAMHDLDLPLVSSP
jgi:prepilin-type N-terminal cleavage/methylation domain-containing protein